MMCLVNLPEYLQPTPTREAAGRGDGKVSESSCERASQGRLSAPRDVSLLPGTSLCSQGRLPAPRDVSLLPSLHRKHSASLSRHDARNESKLREKINRRRRRRRRTALKRPGENSFSFLRRIPKIKRCQRPWPEVASRRGSCSVCRTRNHELLPTAPQSRLPAVLRQEVCFTPATSSALHPSRATPSSTVCLCVPSMIYKLSCTRS